MKLRPWLPEEHAGDLDVWNVWNHPITGTFVLEGVTVLFDCDDLEHDDEDGQVWDYVQLSDADAASLKGRTFKDVVEMRQLVRSFIDSDRKSWTRTSGEFFSAE